MLSSAVPAAPGPAGDVPGSPGLLLPGIGDRNDSQPLPTASDEDIRLAEAEDETDLLQVRVRGTQREGSCKRAFEGGSHGIAAVDELRRLREKLKDLRDITRARTGGRTISASLLRWLHATRLEQVRALFARGELDRSHRDAERPLPAEPDRGRHSIPALCKGHSLRIECGALALRAGGCPRLWDLCWARH